MKIFAKNTPRVPHLTRESGEETHQPSRSSRFRRSESGAALVEFAMVLPLLLILLFGVIESSWAFAQISDVRFGAREGARAAAVNVGDVDIVGQLVCDRMDIILPNQNVSVTLTPLSPSPPGEGSVGASAQITVAADLKTLTGFFDAVFGNKSLTSTIEFRVEQPAGGSGDVAWWAGGTFMCS